MAKGSTPPMTRAELLALPAVLDLPAAGRALGLGRTKSHELVRAGEFPVPVLRIGRAYRVPTAKVLELLGICHPIPGQAGGGGAPAARVVRSWPSACCFSPLRTTA